MKVDEARMGYVLDREGVPIPGSAQLVRKPNGVHLEIMWDGQSSSIFNTWFSPLIVGDGGPIPSSIKFFDGQGTSTLFTTGRPAKYSVRIGEITTRSDQKAIVDISHVVHDDDSYSCIRGLRSESEALVKWLGAPVVSSVINLEEKTIERYESTPVGPIHIGEFEGVAVSLEPKLFTTGVHLNKNDQITLTSRAYVTTHTKYLKNWNSHLQVHRRMRDLLAVASLRKIDFLNDHGFLAPTNSGDWSPVTTSLTGAKTEGFDAADLKFAFHFRNIHPRGIALWLGLWEQGFGRGLTPFITSLRASHLTVEDLCIYVGIALEHIGYQIAVNGGKSPKRADALNHHQKVQRVMDDMSPVIGLDTKAWCSSMSDSYNSLKHNRDAPQPIEVVQRDALSGLEVLRAWVSHKIGADSLVLHALNEPLKISSIIS